jgi:hypothetical protein
MNMVRGLWCRSKMVWGGHIIAKGEATLNASETTPLQIICVGCEWIAYVRSIDNTLLK